MIYVGKFTEEEVRKGIDKKAVEEKKAESGLKYVKTQLVKKGKQITGLKLWLMSLEEYQATNAI